MSTSMRIKNELAHTASTNVQDDMVRLQDPKAWKRVQKFRDAEGLTIRDYFAAGTDVTARVRERGGKIIDVALMTMESINKIRHRDSFVKGRLWDVGQTEDTSRATLRASEFAFGMAKTQDAAAPCLMITPVVYFRRTGQAWEQDHTIEHLLPSWLKKKSPGVYETDGRDYESIAEELIDCGLIELDALSDYHEDQVLLKLSVSHDDTGL